MKANPDLLVFRDTALRSQFLYCSFKKGDLRFGQKIRKPGIFGDQHRITGVQKLTQDRFVSKPIFRTAEQKGSVTFSRIERSFEFGWSAF